MNFRGVKKRTWVYRGVVAAMAVIVCGVGLYISLSLTNKPLQVKLSEAIPVSFVDAGGLAIDCSLAPIDAKKKELIAGDGIKIACSLTNTSKKDYSDLVVQTGIDRTKINYIRELKGATGILQTATDVSFSNLIVMAKARAEVSLVANTNFSKDDYRLAIKPQLKSTDTILSTAKEVSLSAAKYSGPSQMTEEKAKHDGGKQ